MFTKSTKRITVLLTICLIFSQIIFAQVVFAQVPTKYAVLAGAENFADILCAGPLAEEYRAPVLLTGTSELSQDTLNELKRLEVKHLFIIGGLEAVAQNVEDALKAEGINDIKRICGNNRYETSVKIAEELGDCNTIFLATGDKSPSNLSAAKTVSTYRLPILLTTKDSLPSCVALYIQGKSVIQTNFIGGPDEISSGIEKQVPGPVRFAGSL